MGVIVREVTTKKEKKEFLNFPLKLYKDCKYFAPPLYSDEKKIFNKNYVYYDKCKAVYFNAYNENGAMTGRISGILQTASNEKRNEKRVRFTRFDCIDDVETAKALFKAVEDWALSIGMDTVCGPLGFSDLEREGLLVEGFDYMATFEEQYNYEYYGKLIEACGYCKEVDWLEYRVFRPEEMDTKLVEHSKRLMDRYNLHFAHCKTVSEFLERYHEQFFDILDTTYYDLYGTVPFTENMKKMLMDNFRLIIDLKHIDVVVDENDRVVSFGLCFPAIGEAIQASHGHLTPKTLYKVLKAIKEPKVLDMGLIGVLPEYANKGISSSLMGRIMTLLFTDNIDYAETNLILETNHNMHNQLRRFRTKQHKRRRAYVKSLKA